MVSIENSLTYEPYPIPIFIPAILEKKYPKSREALKEFPFLLTRGEEMNVFSFDMFVLRPLRDIPKNNLSLFINEELLESVPCE